MKAPPNCQNKYVHVTGWLTAGPESGDIDPVGEDSVEGIAFHRVEFAKFPVKYNHSESFR